MASYMAAKDRPSYETAAQRMATQDAARQARADQEKQDAVARTAAAEVLLDARISAEVARQIAARP